MATRELRPYQREAIAAVHEHWKEWDRELLVCATGTGKTFTAKCIIEDRLSNGSVLFLAHRDELIEQARATFGDAGKIKGSLTDIRPITVGSVQTLINRPRYEGFKTLIIDEAHHAVSDSYQSVLAQYPDAKVLGLTATPDRKGLGNVFEGIAYEYGLRDAVKDGYLSKIVARTIPIDIDLTKVKTRVGDFEVTGLVEALEPYLPEIAKTMTEFAMDRKTIVFLPLVRMAQEFAEMLRGYGFDAREVDGQSQDRKETLEWFSKAGKGSVLTNAMLLCLDEDTEILTDRGFVGPDDIREDDLVANWNFDGTVFFEKPHEIVRRPLAAIEHMTSIDSRTINLRVTDTHRMVVGCGARRDKWKKIAASELRSGHILPTCGVAEPFDVPVPEPPYERLTFKRVESGELCYTSPNDLTLDECRFIGFFLAEGAATHLQSGGVEYKVSQVSDINPAICEWFDSVVNSCGFNCARKERHVKNLDKSVSYWSFCRGTGHGSQARDGLFRIEPYLNHDGTRLFWGLNEEQFDALIEGFWYGDGFHGTASAGMPRSIQLRGCYQSLFNLWCAIGSVRGWRCAMYERPQKNPKHNTQYELRMIKNMPLHISNKTVINQESYKPESVWCVRTTSKNIITRRNGRVVVMGNTEGWDCPDTDCVVVLRPTKVRSLYSQMVGRGTRLAPNKDNCLLLDFLWLSTRHDLCRPASLITGNDEDAERVSVKAVEDDLELFDALTDVEEQRRNALAEAIRANAKRKARLVDPLTFFVDVNEVALLDYQPEWPWEKQPASEKQVKLIENAGINTDGMCKGQASKVIDAIFKRREAGLATPKQMRMLEQKGFQNVGLWTFEQASNMMERLAKNRWRVPFGVNPKTYVPA